MSLSRFSGEKKGIDPLVDERRKYYMMLFVQFFRNTVNCWVKICSG